MDKINRFKDLDSNCFRAFVAAAEDLNFTKAADRSGMTQSGVSQQIAKLEAQLGTPLFTRINKTVSLTPVGQELLKLIEKQQDDIKEFFEFIGKERNNVSGTVKYAMPHSCLFTPHFSILLKEKKVFPDIKLDIQICPNEKIIDLLIENKIDFGFLTKKSQNPAIINEHFSKETYVLVGPFNSERRLEAKPDSILTLPFIDYPGFNEIFCTWKNEFFGNSRKVAYENLNIHTKIGSLDGVLYVLNEQAGWTVIPKHVVLPLINSKKISIFNFNIKNEATNQIFIGMLGDQRHSARVTKILSFFRKMKDI